MPCQLSIYNNVSMHEFEAMERLFSSIDHPSQKRQEESRGLKMSTITDDKTKVQPRLLSSYLASQICTSQDMCHMGGSMEQTPSPTPLTVRDENRPVPPKTKIDLNRLIGTNSVKQSFLRDTPRGSCSQNHEQFRNSAMNGKLVKQNSKNVGSQRKTLQKDQVESIIFDSKAVKTENSNGEALQQLMQMYAGSSERQLRAFQGKLAEANRGIDAGINNLAKMIKQLRLLSLQKKIKAKEDKCKHMMDSHLFQSKISEMVILEQAASEQEQRQTANDKQETPSASKVELVGSFQSRQAALSQQFTVFINRLCRQIHLDIEFTQIAAQLYRNNALNSAKALIMGQNQGSSLNQSLMEIDPAEMDPLEKKPSSFIQLTQADLQFQANKLLAKLEQIQGHFRSKLRRAFSSSIIGMLFQELSANSHGRQQDSVTVGDLLSYINMRTGNSFRNRFFVKIMKRLDLKPNGPITPNALLIFTQ